MIGTVCQIEILWLEILGSLSLLLSMDMHLVVAVRWVAFLFHQGFRMLYPMDHGFFIIGLECCTPLLLCSWRYFLEGKIVYWGHGWKKEKQANEGVPRVPSASLAFYAATSVSEFEVRQHSALSLNSHSYHMTTTHVTLFDLEVQIHIEGIVASRAGGMWTVTLVSGWQCWRSPGSCKTRILSY